VVQEDSSLGNQQIRLFFEKFAKERNFDPLTPANWYKIKTKHVEMVCAFMT
jgi:hypothetical protein